MGTRNDDTRGETSKRRRRRRRRRLRVPAALAVALVGTSVTLGASMNGCTPAEDPPAPDAGQITSTPGTGHPDAGAGSGGDAGNAGDGGGEVVDGAPVPSDAPSVADAAVDTPVDTPHT